MIQRNLTRLSVLSLTSAMAVLGCASTSMGPVAPPASIVQSAEQGDVKAQYMLGHIYDEGYYEKNTVGRDMEKAVHWWRKSAEAGHPDAQYQLAELYGEGRGVGKDHGESKRWYRKAAWQGHKKAMDKFLELEEIDRQKQEVGKWLEENKPRIDRLIQAAEQGEWEKQYELGKRYQVGLGVVQDSVQAEKWLRASAQSRFGTLGIVAPPAASETEVLASRVVNSRGGYSVDLPATGTPADAAIILIYAGALLGKTVEHVADTMRAKKAKKALQKHVRVSNVVYEIEKRVFVAVSDELSNPVRRVVWASEENDYRYVHDQGIDTVLEVTLQMIGLMEHGTRGSEQFGLVIGARSRLINTADGSVIDENDFRHNGADRETSDWLADNATILHEAIEVGEDDLAQQIIKKMFGIDNRLNSH